MNVRNCRKCGKLFNYAVGQVVCPICKEKAEAKFQDVKKFVQDNRGVGIPEISAECDVEVGQIQKWIREERLVFSDDSPIGIGCESCGTMIKTGRFCEKCKVDMTRGLIGETNKVKEEPKKIEPQKDKPRMRFI